MMLPEVLKGVKPSDVIEIIAEDCLKVNSNISDFFKVLIWTENENYLKYRVTDKYDSKDVFQIPSTMGRHAEALYLVVKELNYSPWQSVVLIFEKDAEGWNMDVTFKYD